MKFLIEIVKIFIKKINTLDSQITHDLFDPFHLIMTYFLDESRLGNHLKYMKVSHYLMVIRGKGVSLCLKLEKMVGEFINKIDRVDDYSSSRASG